MQLSQYIIHFLKSQYKEDYIENNFQVRANIQNTKDLVYKGEFLLPLVVPLHSALEAF